MSSNTKRKKTSTTNQTEYELNLFFDSCNRRVRVDALYLLDLLGIPADDLRNIGTKQPDIDIGIVTKLICERADYYRKLVKTNRGTTSWTFYNKPFDETLTALWFSYYRFLFIKRLNFDDYEEFAVDIVCDSFHAFFKYIDIDIVNSGKQITSLLSSILQCLVTNQFQGKKRLASRYYFNGMLRYEDLISIPSDNTFNEVCEESYLKSLGYVILYIETELPEDKELHEQLRKALRSDTGSISESCKERLKDWMKTNHLTARDVIDNARACYEDSIYFE